MYLFDAKMFPRIYEALGQCRMYEDKELFEIEAIELRGVGFRVWVWLKGVDEPLETNE